MKIEDTERRNNRVRLHHADVYTYNTNSFTCSNCGGQMSQQRGGLMRCHYATEINLYKAVIKIGDMAKELEELKGEDKE